MNKRISDYYSEKKFLDVLCLAEERLPWDEIRSKSPLFPRGWYELSLLSREDRLEFTKEYWMTHLPFVPNPFKDLITFFQELVDVGVFLILQENTYFPELVYFLNDESFYLGSTPASEEEIEGLKMNISLPKDFLEFLKIHNGFSKAYDRGILSTSEILPIKKELELYLDESEKKVHLDKHLIEPTSLIPFYMSAYGRSYQCFIKEWYPTNEMGNVCLSLDDFSISSYKREGTLAFPTFLDWLAFYLEEIEIDEG